MKKLVSKVKKEEDRQRSKVVDSFVKERGMSVCQAVKAIRASQAAGRKEIRKIREEEGYKKPKSKPRPTSGKKTSTSTKKSVKKNPCKAPNTPGQLIRCMEKCCKSFKKGDKKHT